jgi:hypothetical protein
METTKAGLRYGSIAAVLLLTAFCYNRAIRAEHHWGGDFSVYVSETRNLVEHRPVYSSTYVVTAQSARNHPAAYPPLPSLLMIPAYAAGGLDYRAFKLTLGAFAWLSLLLWYGVGIRMGLPPLASAGVTLVFGLGAILYPTLDTVGSDGVYLFFSAASLLAMLWVEQEGWTERRPAASAVLVSGLLLLSIATRAAGLALVLACGLAEALRIIRTRRIRSYALWLGVLVLFGVAVYQLYLYNAAGQYGNQFSLEPRLVLRNMMFYARMAAPLWSPSPSPLRYLLAFSALLLGAYAWITRITEQNVIDLYALVSFGMICAYTVNNDFRYVIPLLPVLLLLAVEGALSIGKKLWPSHPAFLAQALGVLALLATGLNVAAIDASPLTDGVGKPSFKEVAGFLTNTSPDTMILSWNPRVFALYARRPSALYPQDTAADFESQIPPAAHVLLIRYKQPLDEEKLGAYIAKKQPAVEFVDAEFTVYRIR